MGRRRYLTYTWGGKTIRRRVPTKAKQRERIAKFRATMQAKRKEPPAAEAQRAKARHALEALGPARTEPPAGHRAGAGQPHRRPPGKGNGRADARIPDVEGAAFYLHRAQDWIVAARYMGTITDLDPAHRDVIAALGALEGITPPY
jgi:hypothetical protein